MHKIGQPTNSLVTIEKIGYKSFMLVEEKALASRLKRCEQDMLHRLGIEMKVLALVGSHRKHGNTDILVDTLLEGASSENCSVEKLYLYDMDIQPCVDCRNCTKKSFECSIEDDMKMLYSKLGRQMY